MIKLIVAVDENWAIGNENQLLFHIKEDMRHFKELTTDQVVVMGRKTLESMPNGNPLPKRVNIVLSHSLVDERVEVCHSLAELAEKMQTYTDKDIYIIGGAEIYHRLLDFCAEAEITFIKAQAPQADSYFPDLSTQAAWQLLEQSPWQQSGNLAYSFARFRNNQVRPLGELK